MTSLTTASPGNFTNISYLLWYLMTAPPFLLPTKSTMPEYFAISGRSTIIPCKAMNKKSWDVITLIMWFRGESHMPIYTLDARKSKLISARHFPSSEFASRSFFNISAFPPGLQINSVQPEDEGIYKCQIEFKNSPTTSHVCRLYVIVPPKEIIITDVNGQKLNGIAGPYNEGSDVSLVCDVKGGVPQPAVSWWRDSKLVDDDFNSTDNETVRNVFTVTNIHRRDLFTAYICTGSNNNLIFPVSSSVTIDINLKPLEVKITTPRDPLHAEVKTQINCESWGGRPRILLMWNLDDILLESDGGREINNKTQSILTFFPTAEHNGKTLICKAVNPVLPKSVLQTRWKLVVYYIPKVKLRLGSGIVHGSIREGTDVYFECQIDANPPVEEVVWFFERKVIHTNLSEGIIESNKSLVLQKITKQWAGLYTCQASNDVGLSRSPEVMLRVKHAPDSCYLTPNPITVDIGKPIDVTCKANAEPIEVTFRWLFSHHDERNGASSFPIDSSNSTISFVPEAKHINGNISCWGSNGLGEQQIPCTAKIHQAEPPLPVTDCIITNKAPSSFVIACQYTGKKGLNKIFHLEVYSSNLENLIVNTSSDQKPVFIMSNINSSISYILKLYVSNQKGRSETVTYEYNLSAPGHMSSVHGRETTFNIKLIIIVPLCIIIITLIVILICFVVFHRRKRRKGNRKRRTDGNREQMKETVANEGADRSLLRNANPDVIQNIPSEISLQDTHTEKSDEERMELVSGTTEDSVFLKYTIKTPKTGNEELCQQLGECAL